MSKYISTNGLQCFPAEDKKMICVGAEPIELDPTNRSVKILLAKKRIKKVSDKQASQSESKKEETKVIPKQKPKAKASTKAVQPKEEAGKATADKENENS